MFTHCTNITKHSTFTLYGRNLRCQREVVVKVNKVFPGNVTLHVLVYHLISKELLN